MRAQQFMSSAELQEAISYTSNRIHETTPTETQHHALNSHLLDLLRIQRERAKLQTIDLVEPITQRVASFSPETLRFAEQCAKEQESKS